MGVIEWNQDPEIFRIGGFAVRYYSVLFVLGLYLGFVYAKKRFFAAGWTLEEVEKLGFLILIATILGARLGHCLFYEPEYYLSRPWEMILPFKFVDGNFSLTGYRGLASHGGILGVFLSIIYFCRKNGKNLWATLDIVALGGAIAAIFIRLANFMNSEILGKATEGDYGVIFKRVDDVARHPAQLYESFAYFIIFLIIAFVYKKYKGKFQDGFVFGLFFVLLFAARIFIETFKINQVSFEDGMALNMGQLLSILPLIFGLVVMWWKRPK